MLSITQLELSYGPQILFKDVNLNLNSGKRYGLIGANGAGKSSLLHIVTDPSQSTQGHISYPKDAKLGWLKQDQFRYEDTPVVDVVIQGNKVLWQALTEKKQLLEEAADDQQTGLRLGQLEEVIAHESGYTIQTLAHTLLTGLGVDHSYHLGPLSALSGGYKLRVLLAQALCAQPDILLLDEPTNHLDILSIEWLTDYLRQQFKGVLLFVSHDRGFLDNVATHILDIDYHTITQYTGNYTAFVKRKEEAYLEQEKILKGQQQKIEQLQSFVSRFGAKASKAKQAKAKQKQIDRIEQVQLQPSTRQSPHFSFKPVRASGKIVLHASHVCKGFAGNNVLNDINLTVHRNEKIAIIGKNGLGKSTLLNILMNTLTADSGHIEWGHECHIAYFAQDNRALLNSKTNLLNWLAEHTVAETKQIRQVLGQVLFSGELAEKSAASLSGGEGARLLFARMMLSKHNVLLLDEPTNHLDLESVQALAEALKQYQGTVLVVSHDSYFINGVAERIIALTETGLKDFSGTYHEFIAQHGSLADELSSQHNEATIQSSHHATTNISRDRLEKRLARIHDKIEALEAKIQAVDHQFADSGFYQQASSDDIARLKQQKDTDSEALADLTLKWEALIAQLDQMADNKP